MRFTVATTLLFAAIALTSPAPLANPDAMAEPITIAQFRNALSARDVLTVPDIQLEERASSISKRKKGGKVGSGNSSSAASDMLSPNRVLQVAVLGLGVVQVVRLWG